MGDRYTFWDMVKDYCRDFSVKLGGDSGGDTHIHPHKEGEASGVVTTQFNGDYGEYKEHTYVRDPQTFNRDETGDSKTPEDLTGFRSLFGDDNK